MRLYPMTSSRIEWMLGEEMDIIHSGNLIKVKLPTLLDCQA
jgi:hypothetical protein